MWWTYTHIYMYQYVHKYVIDYKRYYQTKVAYVKIKDASLAVKTKSIGIMCSCIVDSRVSQLFNYLCIGYTKSARVS